MKPCKTVLSLVFASMLAMASAATPNWSEDFSALTPGTVFNAVAIPPTTVMTGLPKAADMTGDWLAGVRQAASSITVDNTYAAGTISGGTAPTGNNRLLFDSTSTNTNDDCMLISPNSVGAAGTYKYEVMIAFPQAASATAKPGNFVIGVSPLDTTGAKVYTGTGANIAPIFQLQVGTDAPSHLWRMMKGGALVAGSTASPTIAWDALGQQWIKVGIEINPATNVVNGYLNDQLSWTYDFTAQKDAAWDLSGSFLAIRAYPAMTQRAYVSTVSYTTSGGPTTQPTAVRSWEEWQAE